MTARSALVIVNGQIEQLQSGDTLSGASGGGPNSGAITSKSADYTAVSTDYCILVSAAGANRTISLPAAASNSGMIVVIKKTDSSANTVTIDPNASELIDGATTHVISNQYDARKCICDGAAWYII